MGILFYLISVSLVAAVTVGASLGIGFYLLVHPAEQIAAERALSPGAGPGDAEVVGGAALPDRAAPTLGGADVPQSATATDSSAAATEAGAPNKSAADQPPASTFSASEASSPVAGATSPDDSAPAPPKLAIPPLGEGVSESAQSERQGDEGASGSLREAGHFAIQNFARDAQTQSARGEPPNDTSPEVNRDAVQPNKNPDVRRGPPGGPASEPPLPTEVIRGVVTDAPNVATWIVGGRTVRLFGINPGPPKLIASLVNWVRAKGPVECLPRAETLRYRCFTARGEDIAEAALLAGAGRAGEGATTAYENAESHARRMGKGLWARR